MGENINYTKNKNEGTICCKYVSGQQVCTLVPEVFLDFSLRKRSRGSREAATTSRESDEEREKNLWLP